MSLIRSLHVCLCATWMLTVVLAFGCGGESGPPLNPGDPQPGDSRFASADGYQGQPASRGTDDMADGAPSPEAGAGGSGGDDGRTVEEGDIYRAFGADLLLNVNYYRGLQVIELSDLSAPAVIGRVEISGYPVELYVVGSRAFILLNDWRGYYGSRYDTAVQAASGGVVVSVDLSDPAAPVIVDQAVVPGSIYKSRLTRGGGQESLYVVAQQYGYVANPSGGSSWTTSTVVKSFHLGGGLIAPQTELELGGWITDIQATPEALLVARSDWNHSSGRSLVSIIDISRPDGVMVEGGEVQVAGPVNNQFNLDLRDGILRVVSSRNWGSSSSNSNHIETFDATDFDNLVPIDSKSFGPNEDLFGTIFLGNSAFFVTYERQDPFHAFEISDAGIATEKSQFIVSGWNDFFRSTFDDQRLIGIGVEDTGGRTMAVSLYDITDLENANPLIQRVEVDAASSWSEASWDHRAFSVVEDAIHVPGPGGVDETGLILLPYSSWDSSSWVAGVQIFTFSQDTLSRRGTMNHGSQVRRSFLTAGGATANLSEEALSLYSTATPDQPAELGRLDLAPSYSGLLSFGSHLTRLREASGSWYGARGADGQRPSTVQIIPAGEHPDTAAPVASFDVPAGSTLHKLGDLLVAVSTTPVDPWAEPPVWETTLQSFDLSTPSRPEPRGALVTRDLPVGGYDYYYYGDMDCFDCGYGYYPYGRSAPEVHAVGDSLVFVRQEPGSTLLGTAQVCHSYMSNYRSCYGQPGTCNDTSGYQTCTTFEGQTSCYGSFRSCTYTDGQLESCVQVDPSQVQATESCYPQEVRRYWSRFELRAVSFRQPNAPSLGAKMQAPLGEEAVTVVPSGDLLFLSYKKPIQIAGDSRPYVQYFMKAVTAGASGSLTAGSAINVPGELLQVQGNTAFTRDYVWGSTALETAVARVRLAGATAYLEAHRRFPDRIVDSTRLDGAGHLLVGHRGDWRSDAPSIRSGGASSSDSSTTDSSYMEQRLTILDAASTSFSELATVAVDDWASLRDARAGRALFEVPGGLLVFNLDQPTAPYPQAFFALRGWPTGLLMEGRKIIVPAGPYGIYQLGLDDTNLLEAR